MRIAHRITTVVEGTLDEIVATPTPAGVLPTLDEVLDTMAGLAFMVECVAHLQGKERELLPTAEKARKLIAALRP